MSTGLSIRKAAAALGVNRKTVQRHIDNGTIADAILPDGSIDIDRARAILADTMTRGPLAGDAVREARLVRARTKTVLLAAQVADLRDAYIPADDMAAILRGEAATVVGLLRQFPADAAPALAGLNAEHAKPVLKAAVLRLLASLSDESTAPPRPEPEPLPDLAGIPATGVEIQKLGLESETDLWRLALKRGQATKIEDEVNSWSERCSVVKGFLLGLPGSPRLDFVGCDAAAVTRMLAKEVRHCIAILDVEAYGIAA